MKLDLTIGSPDLHAEIWQSSPLAPPSDRRLSDGMGYIKSGCVAFLEEHIRDAHEFDGNVSNLTNNTQIVLGAGATQLLMATLQYFKQYGGVRVPRPSWFRIDDMAKMRDCPVNDDYSRLVLATCPNNPDGEIQIAEHSSVVYDAVYNWRHYFYTEVRRPVLDLDKCIGAIFSLSKYTGHAGTRLGWILTNNQDYANFVRNYIEFDSSGVSVDAQYRALDVLDAFLDLNIGTHIRLKLQERYVQMCYICHRHKLTLKSTNGMFAWVEGENVDKVFEARGVQVMPGHRFHASDSFCRINLAVDSFTWERFTNAMA